MIHKLFTGTKAVVDALNKLKIRGAFEKQKESGSRPEPRP